MLWVVPGAISGAKRIHGLVTVTLCALAAIGVAGCGESADRNPTGATVPKMRSKMLSVPVQQRRVAVQVLPRTNLQYRAGAARVTAEQLEGNLGREEQRLMEASKARETP